MLESTAPLEAPSLKSPPPAFAESNPTVGTNQIIAGGEAKNAKVAQKHLHHVQFGDAPTHPKSGTGQPGAPPSGSPEGAAIGDGDKSLQRLPLAIESRTNAGGFKETSKYYPGEKVTEAADGAGNLRQRTVDQDKTPDGKLDATDQQSWDANGRLTQDDHRWRDDKNVWHERNWMKMDDGTTISATMDGDKTTTDRVTPDGKKSTVVKTMNVPVEGHPGRYTMTVESSEGQ